MKVLYFSITSSINYNKLSQDINSYKKIGKALRSISCYLLSNIGILSKKPIYTFKSI